MRHAGIESASLSLIWQWLMLGTNVVAGAGIGSPFGPASLSSPKGRGGFDSSDRLAGAHEQFTMVHSNIVAKRAVALAKLLKAGKEVVPKEEWYSWREAVRAFMTGYMPWQKRQAGESKAKQDK